MLGCSKVSNYLSELGKQLERKLTLMPVPFLLFVLIFKGQRKGGEGCSTGRGNLTDLDLWDSDDCRDC